MPVVINDFEVVPEPAGPPPAATSQSPAPEPPDIERILAIYRARAERARAY